VAPASNRENRYEHTSLNSPGAAPEDDFPAAAQPPAAACGARELSGEDLRAKVAELAEQVRRLANGSQPPGAGAPAAPAFAASNGDAGASKPAANATEEFARQSAGLLQAVIETAELAAAEIRAGAEREAAGIRERATAAIGEADAALERYREALTALGKETERIKDAVAALREQAVALEAERAQIDTALDRLRRRP
jgi:flagellin-like hook-associated protein FlgL